jgi:hypothetical protein
MVTRKAMQAQIYTEQNLWYCLPEAGFALRIMQGLIPLID